VTVLDWIIVGLVLLSAGAGWFQGFLVGAATLAGFAGGLVLGARVGGAIVSGGAQSPYAPLFALGGALIGGVLLGGALETLGWGLRRRIVGAPGLATLDGAGGALLSAAAALGFAWLLGAVALQTPGARQFRHAIQRSAILRRLNDVLPPSGGILHALARFDPFPQLNGPSTRLPAPSAAIARAPAVRAAAAGVVRIQGTACGLGVEGSGWIAAPGVVVTNAHVVAGEDDTSVQLRGSGPALPAAAIAFDPHDDVAVLRVPGLGGSPLRMAGSATAGTGAAILGFPHDGPYDVRAARVGTTQTVISQDAYGRGPIRRQMTPFRGLVRAGNSGGPLVDEGGRVLATVFASTRMGPHGGYAVPDGVVASVLRSARGTVSTGACTA
jgi:S1-C subfamily serine protease